MKVKTTAEPVSSDLSLEYGGRSHQADDLLLLEVFNAGSSRTYSEKPLYRHCQNTIFALQKVYRSIPRH